MLFFSTDLSKDLAGADVIAEWNVMHLFLDDVPNFIQKYKWLTLNLTQTLAIRFYFNTPKTNKQKQQTKRNKQNKTTKQKQAWFQMAAGT